MYNMYAFGKLYNLFVWLSTLVLMESPVRQKESCQTFTIIILEVEKQTELGSNYGESALKKPIQ